MTLTLTESSLNNFQWMEWKCFEKILRKKIICCHILSKKFSQKIFAPIKLKLFEPGKVSVRDIRKKLTVFQEGGSTPAPLTPPVIRVVLLHTHTERYVQSFNSLTVYTNIPRCNLSFPKLLKKTSWAGILILIFWGKGFYLIILIPFNKFLILNLQLINITAAVSYLWDGPIVRAN